MRKWQDGESGKMATPLNSLFFVFMLVEKLFCSFFNPVISLYIYHDHYEKYGEKKFPAVGSMEMAAILNFRALTKVHYNIKTTSSDAVKSCTHLEDIYMKKHVYRSVLVLLTIKF